MNVEQKSKRPVIFVPKVHMFQAAFDTLELLVEFPKHNVAGVLVDYLLLGLNKWWENIEVRYTLDPC